jgi:hypothetical protein
LFHRKRITSPVRPRNSARSRQTKASVPAITDRGCGQSSARIVGCASRSSARSIASLCSGRYDELQAIREGQGRLDKSASILSVGSPAALPAGSCALVG